MDRSDFNLLLDLVLDIKETQDKNTVTLEQNTTVLDEHARRSTASEARIARLERREQMINGFLKISGMIAAGVSTAYGLFEIIQRLL